MDSKLTNKVVLITGATGGIGRACARCFAKEGAKLVLHGYQNMQVAEKLARELSVESIVVQANLTEEEQVERLFQDALSTFSKIDSVVTNAGATLDPSDDKPVQKICLQRWDHIISTNLTSVFLCAREFFKTLETSAQKSAALTIIGSTSAIFGAEGLLDYSSAKAGSTYGITRTLKNEIVRLAPKGRVNAVCPGWTNTATARKWLYDKNEVQNALQTRSLLEIAQPEDVARLIVFLSSDYLAGHITGEIITIAGGMEGRVLHDQETIPYKEI